MEATGAGGGMVLSYLSRRLLHIVIQSQFVRNVTTTLGAQAVSLGFSMISAGLIARFLGSEGKGIVALALMVPGVLALLLSGGVGLANVYLVGSGKLTLREASSVSVTFAILASMAGLAIVSGVSVGGWLGSLIPGMPATLQGLAIILLPLTLLDGYLSTLLMGTQRITSLNVVTTIMACVNAVGVAVFLGSWQWGAVGAVMASIAATLSSLLLKGVLLNRMGATFRPSWAPRTMRRMVEFGFRGHVGNVLQFLNYRLDVFILNYFSGLSAVGIYGAAVAVAELLWQLPNAVGFVILPKAATSDATTLNAFTPRVLRTTLALTAAAGAVLAVGGRTLIEWVYSAAFAAAYDPLLGLLPGVVLLSGFKVLANEMAGQGYPQYNSAVSGTTLTVTVLLDLLLIPRWGAVGAAIASSVAYATAFLLSLMFYVRVARRAALTKVEVMSGVS